ncbi:MAG: hypothetical protein DDT32_02148 [Syntrophomonadaceae bacterium]|nr:hypothetical protein [Bacillota bacterium]
MKVEYDPKHDVMNIELISNTPIAESVELDDGVILDYSRDKKLSLEPLAKVHMM